LTGEDLANSPKGKGRLAISELHRPAENHTTTFFRIAAHRTLKECRSLQQALADLMAKYRSLPPNNERSALERMIDGLEAEIAVRKARTV